MTAPLDRPKPSGFRRVERTLVGFAMSVIAFILEKVVMRSVRREGGQPTQTPATTMTSKGVEIDVDEE